MFFCLILICLAVHLINFWVLNVILSCYLVFLLQYLAAASVAPFGYYPLASVPHAVFFLVVLSFSFPGVSTDECFQLPSILFFIAKIIFD